MNTCNHEIMKSELQKICKKCGRYVIFGKKIYTGDLYEGTDGHTFNNIEDAIKWESGYLKKGKS